MGNHESFATLRDKLITIVAIVMSLYHIAVLSNFHTYLLGMPPLQLVLQRAISLAFVLVLVFLRTRISKKTHQDRIPWYDWLMIILSIITNAWAVIHSERFVSMGSGWERPWLIDIILCLVLVLLILEGTRRVIGEVMVGVAVFFLVHVGFGSYFPGFMHSRQVSLESIVVQLYASSGGIYGLAMGVAATLIMAFVIFASFLQASGAGEAFIQVALALAGRFRGGPAKVAIIASSLMGTVSGSGLANVATTGVITIPMMKKIGYRPEFAGAVEAVASNGGQIMPPVMGAVAFIISEFLQMPYSQVCIAAALPAILYYVALFTMVDLEAARTGLKGMPPEEIPYFWKTLKNNWLLLTPILCLIVTLIVIELPPETSCMVSILFLIVVTMFSKKTRMGRAKLLEALKGGGTGMIEVGAGCASAGLIIFSVMFTGLSFTFSILLTSLAGGNTFFMLALGAIASFILGMGLSSIPCYITLAMLIGPALIQAGITPIAAHLFFFYWGILSFITPPVAMAAFLAASIAEGNMFKTGWIATRLGVVSYLVPFIFVYHPALLLKGSPGDVILATITAVLGTLALSSGLEGYLVRDESWTERILMIAAGVLLIAPGFITDAIGLACAIVVVIWQMAKLKGQIAPQ